MKDKPVTIKRFHWLKNGDSPKTGSAHVSIRCPECEMQSKTTPMETPDSNGVLDFTCRSGMDMCRWQGVVQLSGWKKYQEGVSCRP